MAELAAHDRFVVKEGVVKKTINPPPADPRRPPAPRSQSVLRCCPTCNSPDPSPHPAVGFEGEVCLCEDTWHRPTAPEIRAKEAAVGV